MTECIRGKGVPQNYSLVLGRSNVSKPSRGFATVTISPLRSHIAMLSSHPPGADIAEYERWTEVGSASRHFRGVYMHGLTRGPDYFVPRRDAKCCDKYVCLFVCLSVCPSAHITRKPHGRTSTNFMHVAYSRPLVSTSSSRYVRVAIRYVFLVLWITS